MSLRLVGILAAAGLSIPALAQSDKPLSGPPVKTDRPSHLQDNFSEGGKEGKREPMNERGVPMRQYLDIIAKLRGDSAPADVRLSVDQAAKIDQIADEFRQAARTYAENARKEAGDTPPPPPRPRPAADPAAPPPTDQPLAPARRARLEEFRRNGPKPLDYEVKMWAVLSHPQQAFVQGEVDKIHAEQDKRQGEEYMRRQLEKRRGAEPAPAGQPQPVRPAANQPPGPDSPVRERFQRIMQRLRDLPPDQREEVLRRLEDDLDRRGVPAGDNQPPPPRPRRPDRAAPPSTPDDAKPAPNMDDVKVPPPPKGG